MHKINKKPVRSFNASIAAFDYQPMQISNTYTEHTVPILIKRDMKPKKYNLVMDFNSQHDISRFISEVVDRFELRIDDGYVYTCYLDCVPSVQQEGVYSFTLTLSLLVLQRGEERRFTLKNGDNYITIKGTYKAGIRYEITPHYNGEITVGGYTIRNIHTGKQIILDGESMLITEYGKNKYSDAMFTKFPSLEPGDHIITVSNTNADVVMYYSPVYL